MRIACALFIALAAAPAWAAWEKVAESLEAVHYLDPATIHANGALRRVWALQDMRYAGADGVTSIRTLEEYDCAGERFRYLVVAAHSGRMAGGHLLQLHDMIDEWAGMPPGTRPSAKHRIVCAH